MVLGLSKKVKTEPTVDPVAREEKIQRKLFKIANAIKIPAPINQFRTFLDEIDEKRVMDLFAKYKPENKEEKRKRLESADPRAGPKPILTKFGLKHLTDLISSKKVKLVLIAADVTPITVVVWLPTLCKRMGVAYAIVRQREMLGGLVNLKSSAAIGLEDVRAEDSAEFSQILNICNATYAGQYEKHMSVTGGGRMNIPDSECLKKETYTN